MLHGDDTQDWQTEVADFGSRYEKLFTARRKLDTGDPEDFAIQLDRQFEIMFEVSRQSDNQSYMTEP